MTQVEFDRLMNEIRQEQISRKAMLSAELHEIEDRRKEVRKEYDAAHERYKAVCQEIESKQKEIKAVNAEYYERKKSLIKAFPKAIGTREEENCRKRNWCFRTREKMISKLKEEFKDSPGIDAENINVHFMLDGENVSFTAIIPKLS